MDKSGIYVITAPNGRAYIGSSKHLEKRRKQHFYELRCQKHHCVALQNAWNKYGEQLQFKIVQMCEENQLLFNEQWWIDNAHVIWKRLYNGSKIAGRIEMTDEVRAKMSFKARNKPPISDETRAKLSEAGKGRKLKPHHLEMLKNRVFTEENRANMSAAQKGHVVSVECREKLSNSLKGKSFHTENSKAKISEALRNRPPISDETRQKLKAAQANKPPVSDETRAKMSAAKLGKKLNLTPEQLKKRKENLDLARAKRGLSGKPRKPHSEQALANLREGAKKRSETARLRRENNFSEVSA